MNRKRMRSILSLLLILVSVWMMLCSCTPDKPQKNAESIPVLTYHRVMTPEGKNRYFPNDQWANNLDHFRADMQYLHDKGYTPITMDEFADWFDGTTCIDPQKKPVVITFDDGSAETYYNVMPVLKEFGFPATTFIIGEKVIDKRKGEFREGESTADNPTYMTREELDKIREEYPALSVESHTWSYHRQNSKSEPLLMGASLASVSADLKKMKDVYGCKYFAYPYGKRTGMAERALRESGYRLAFGFGQNDCPYRPATRMDNRWYISRIKVNQDGEKVENFARILEQNQY